MDSQQYDLVIIGGGPAGMTAAIYAARANLRAIVLESNITGGLVNSTHTVENFPSYPSIHGMELMEKMRAHVDSLQVPVEEICEIEHIALEGDVKRVQTGEGLFTAKSVLLATGRRPIPLEIPTEAQEIHYCAICDGAPYAGKQVLVVGGGNSAFDESLYLLQLGVAGLTLIEVTDRYYAAQTTQDMLLAHANTEAFVHTRLHDVEVRNGKLRAAILECTETGAQRTAPVDGIFVFLGQQPNNHLFAHQLALSEQGYVLVNPNMSTSLPGVFAAGDITDKACRQITTAVADGTIAALSVERYVRTLPASKTA